MTKAKVLLILAFVVVCAAGVVVGTAVDRHVHSVGITEPPPRGPFPGIDLSADQQKSLRQAWEPVGKFRGEMFHKRHEFDDQRWSAIQALFTPEQKSQFDQIQASYKKQVKELDSELAAKVDAANAATKTILTPEQFKKWTDMRKAHEHGPGHEMGGPPPGIGGPPMHGRRGDRRHSGGPTSGPSSDSGDTRPSDLPPPSSPQ